MITEPKHKRTGQSLIEVIAQFSNELPDDAVGIWQIVPKGREAFGLGIEQLTDFMRRANLALLEAGAVPVRHVPGTGFEWVHQTQYGTEPAQIAANIITEW